MAYNLPTRPHNPPYSRPPSVLPPLPMGWSEHKAPTGHSYYYHAASNTSTYTRPTAPPVPAPVPFAHQGPFPVPNYNQQPYGGYPQQQFQQSYGNQQYLQQYGQGQHFPPNYGQGRGGFGRGGRANYRGGRQHQYQGPRKQEKPDRPKSKRAIPGKDPWVLVTTKFGRKFVHNTETKESLWKAPEDLQAAIDAMPEETPEEKEARRKVREERRRIRKEKGKEVEVVQKEEEPKGGEEEQKEEEEKPRGVKRSASAALESGASAKEEPEEETEEEEEEEEEDEEDEHDEKRLKTEGEASGPIEFTEDDIAWQLAAMGEEYLEEEEYEGEGLEEDTLTQFKALLNESQTNPFATWELAYPPLVDDPRYVLPGSTKARKEIFTQWAKEKITEIKEEKEKEKKVDPRIPLWDFLKEKAAGTKLYWPEFKRKWRKEPVMRDSKVVDRDREKMFRDFIAHMKLSPELRENDLKKLLKSTSSLTRQTVISNLPDSITTDVRYVVAPEKTRDEIITAHISTLPATAESEETRREREEKVRKEMALRERERTVRREQARYRDEERAARDRLREEEAAIERAKVVGKRGLLGHLVKKEEVKEETKEGEGAAVKDEAKEGGET
ncbi:hypothetical protein RUND412_000794 [Rhizina undulata]